jgi:hypothetical protein
MPILSHDQILTVNDIAIEILPVPEWGGEVYVKTISAAERGMIEARMIEMGSNGQPKNIKIENLTTFIAFLSICDETGKRIFTDIKDIEQLGKKSAAAIDRVAEKAQSLARISPADIEKMVGDLKNSHPAALPTV